MKSKKVAFETEHFIVQKKHKANSMEQYFGQVNEEGLKHGFGRECWVSGQIYEGQFKNGKYHGFGRQIDYNFIYVGEFKDGQRMKGLRIWKSGRQDDGDYGYYKKPTFDKYGNKILI